MHAKCLKTPKNVVANLTKLNLVNTVYVFSVLFNREAWKQLGDMNQHTAMKEYISQLTAIVPDWQEKADSSNKSEKVSTLHVW